MESRPSRQLCAHTWDMDFHNEAEDDVEKPLNELALPRHLAALIGALQGPADLGVHHDRHLT